MPGDNGGKEGGFCGSMDEGLEGRLKRLEAVERVAVLVVGGGMSSWR